MAVCHILENVNNFMQIFQPALCELKPNNIILLQFERQRPELSRVCFIRLCHLEDIFNFPFVRNYSKKYKLSKQPDFAL